jgi:hypothetical protein
MLCPTGQLWSPGCNENGCGSTVSMAPALKMLSTRHIRLSWALQVSHPPPPPLCFALRTPALLCHIHSAGLKIDPTDHHAGSDITQPVPGLAPWLQDAPVAAQVYARHMRSVCQQRASVDGSIAFRCHHEIPGLLRGRRSRIANLKAAIASPATRPGLATVLQRALTTEELRLESDAEVLRPFSDAAQLPPPPIVELLEECDDNLWDAERPVPGSLEAEYVAEEEAAAHEAAHEPLIEAEASAVDSGSLGLMAAAPNADDDDDVPDVLACHCSYPFPRFNNVGTLEEACSEDLPPNHAIVKVTVHGLSEVLYRNDFQSLLSGNWLLSGPINLQLVMLQVSSSLQLP